jgi:lipopolysaccharide transport system ATP-binding protein
MTKTAIKVEDLSKLYRLGEVGTGTLSHDLNRWWQRVQGKEDPYLKLGEENSRDKKGGDWVWALRNIDFEIKAGEVLGIIGKNGAGKSTLLKLLSRVTAPTTGRIKAKGRIASLLEVGTGFHPELTGKENIFLNGAILGMTKSEIKRKFDDIVEFAGVERYIDTPVKRYSSGMYVRLAFAVAAHLESEILIVDEVLAVGDMEFQNKCIGKMSDVSNKEGRTVLFVSHNMGAMRSLCKTGLVMKNGRLLVQGTIEKAIESYINDHQLNGDTSYLDCKEYENDQLSLSTLSILNSVNELSSNFLSNEDIYIQLNYSVNRDIRNLRIIALIKTSSGIVVFETSDTTADQTGYRKKGVYSSTLLIPANLLNIDKYVVQVVVDKPSEEKVFGPLEVSFTVSELMESQIGVVDVKPQGVIHPQFNWQINKRD